jgi:23S rRNA pseudouridine1911/1915/1917 synthase
MVGKDMDAEAHVGGNRFIPVPPAAEGKRIDQFLADAFPDFSRAFFQRAIKQKLVLLQGMPCRPADRLRSGDQLTVEWPEKPASTAEITAEEIPLDILFEDAHILVLNKPAGLVVHPTRNRADGTLVHALLHHDEESFSDLLDEQLRPGIVHRLDKDTSGVLVVAKTGDAFVRLKEAFKARDVEKIYLAVVLGDFGAVTGTIDANIGRHPVNRTKMAVVDDGRHAVTHYRVLAATENVSLLEVRIETGRTHQIRVHFAHLHHPIIGDIVYGGRQKRVGGRVPRQLLHAWKLTFPHPETGVMRQYMAPVPDDFCRALEQFGLPPIAGC